MAACCRRWPQGSCSSFSSGVAPPGGRLLARAPPRTSHNYRSGSRKGPCCIWCSPRRRRRLLEKVPPAPPGLSLLGRVPYRACALWVVWLGSDNFRAVASRLLLLFVVGGCLGTSRKWGPQCPSSHAACHCGRGVKGARQPGSRAALLATTCQGSKQSTSRALAGGRVPAACRPYSMWRCGAACWPQHYGSTWPGNCRRAPLAPPATTLLWFCTSHWVSPAQPAREARRGAGRSARGGGGCERRQGACLLTTARPACCGVPQAPCAGAGS